MPRAPRRCSRPDCDERVLCPTHNAPWGGSQRSGSTRASRRRADNIRSRDPICRCPGCRRCTPSGCTRESTDVDHIVNRAAGGSDDPSNLRGMCLPCHKLKTQQEAARGRGL